MYIYDCNYVSNEIFSILFADDINVLWKAIILNRAIEIRNSELEKNIKLANRKQMNFNVSKSQFMIFPRARIKTDSIKIPLGKSTTKLQ